MYYVFNGKDWLKFKDYKQLINHVAQNNFRWGTEVENAFINYVGVNDNDTYWEPSGMISVTGRYVPRFYRVLNEDGNSIYDEQFIKDVKNWTYSKEIRDEWYRWIKSDIKHHYYHGYYNLPASAYPEFRKGPWPHIHNRYRGSIYRSIRTANELRQSCDPEYKDFIRAKRGHNLPDAWIDEPVRTWRDHNWKRQGHNRHQWEIGVKNREKHKFGKGVYVVKNHSLIEDDWF